MWPGLEKALAGLRRDDENSIHALDVWLLGAIEKLEPSTREELRSSERLRMGPRGRGPELQMEYLVLWLEDVEHDRRFVAPEPAGDGGRLRWTLTAPGRARRKRLRGVLARLGGVLAFVVRAPSVWAGAVDRVERRARVRIGEPPPGRLKGPRITVSPGDHDSMTPGQARKNMEQVKHIVVLMMENRSFDHMLGYLDLLDEQEHVDGPSKAAPIMYGGVPRRPGYLEETALPKDLDPPHGRDAIAEQINGGAMDGFIESFATRNDALNPWLVMGYYTHLELPVYDYLAHSFAICDRWFSSVPSSTWQNRLYSLAATCEKKREKLFVKGRPFNLASFVPLLENSDDPATWRWYSWDPGTLRMVDGRFRDPRKAFHHDHFRRVAQHSIEPPPEDGEPTAEVIELGSGFLQDAANGDLPSVAWIDPNFVDLSILDSNSNDDHPPSDVRAGQELVMMVFRALAESPCWKDTMLIVTYDEHGGFYDHVEPPPPPEPESKRQFDRYGVRVPAFVVSPFVEPCTVSHTHFDHTSIIRTILERFGRRDALRDMAATGPRVAHAENLGRLLTRDPRGDFSVPDYSGVNERLGDWRHGRAERRSAASRELATPQPPRAIVGFPADYLHAARELRAEGLPAGHP
jgi:phospholipase C